eukprot:CAMPEP_0113496192 /NCGR_PEP_ID=MMETSP0014_2-20120614/29995_1 /TAXON_ID=2857 /ORGANISM="Nitzschia sp." /LENGTH=1477 /DNA_ID=CAMNT_0000390107 /DNA_START=130 /DNA_END=4562 /DNA_ORIENTATION=- /assembly_acc=CAM_ASM_000159
MTSTTSMKTLSEDNVNHQADTGTCFPRRLEQRQKRQHLQQQHHQLHEQGMKQVQGQSKWQLLHHNHNSNRGGAVGSGLVEEHLDGLRIPHNSSKAATTNSITEKNKNVKTLKQIIRERLQDVEEETGGKKMIFDDDDDDDFENERDMYAPVALSDIGTYDMESERVGREIFDFEYGRNHQGDRGDDDQGEEKGAKSSGVVWINELPMDLTAWDWYPSLEGLRKGKGFGESPVCVTETDHFTEYDRINFLQAPSALEGQAGSGPSIEMTDDMDEEDISNVFEDDFKPSTFKDPLPSLKTVGGSKDPGGGTTTKTTTMASTTTMKTLLEDNVNHQADTGTCFPRRLEERQNRQYLQQLREQGMKQVQGQSQSQLHHHNHNRTRGGAVGSGIVEEHLAGLGLPNNSSKTATTNSITENNENVKTLKQIIRERMQDGEEEAGGKKVIIDDDFENELDMYAPVALSDIETYDMESERVGREIFDFEFGRKHQGGRRDDDQVEEKGFVSSGVVWINELPMDLTAWDWYPSLEGLRKGKGFGESPVCVTETDHFTEYDRINFLQAPSALEGQAGSGPSIEMTDDMDEEDFSNVFEDDFKPSTFKDPLPSLKTAGGSKAPPKKVSSNVFDTKSVLLQKETGVDDASTTFDFPDNVWAAHTASDGKYARAFPRDSNCVPMTGDEVDACSSLCDLHRASSCTRAPSMALEGVKSSQKSPSIVARRHDKNVKTSTEVLSTTPRVLFPSATSDDFGRDVSTTVTNDLMHDSRQERSVDPAWFEPSQIVPFKHTPNCLQKPSKGKVDYSLTQVAMNLIADDSRSLLHSKHGPGTKSRETKAATQTSHRASRSAKTKATVCVTEADHFTEYNRINFLRAPSGMEGQADLGPSIEMTDDMDEEDISNVFEDDFKPSTFKDPLPSLKTVGGSKDPPKIVSYNVLDTKSVTLQKETGVDDASTTFDFPDSVWADHQASDGKYAREVSRDSNRVPMTGDEVDACSSLCDLHRASSRTLAPSMTLEVVPKMPSNVARRHHKNVKISTEVPSTNPRVLFPSAVSDDFGRDVSTTVTKDLMHDSHQEKFVDTAWLEPSQIAPFKHTPNWLQKPSKGKEYFSLTQVAMNLIADDSRSLLHSIHSAGTKPKETKAATQTTHRASRSAKTKAKRTIKTAVASRRPKYRLPSSQTTNGSALSRAKRGAESSISSTIVSPVERMCSGRPRGLGVVLGPSLRTVKWPDATEQERANLKDGKKVRAPSDPSSRAASTSGKDVPGRRQKRTVKARIVSRKKQQEGMVRKKSPPRLLERDQERSTPLTKSPTEVAATVSSGPVFNSTYNEKWKKNVERFEVFRKKHGHGCVPVKYPEDQILAGWATRQRMHYARYVGSSKGKTLLTVERVEELTRLGFCWDNFQRGWYAKFDMLSKYVEKHGSIKGASSRNNRKAYPGLSAWLRFQRKVFKDYLTPESRAKLKDDQEERFKLLEGLDLNWLLIDDDL